MALPDAVFPPWICPRMLTAACLSAASTARLGAMGPKVNKFVQEAVDLVRRPPPPQPSFPHLGHAAGDAPHPPRPHAVPLTLRTGCCPARRCLEATPRRRRTMRYRSCTSRPTRMPSWDGAGCGATGLPPSPPANRGKGKQQARPSQTAVEDALVRSSCWRRLPACRAVAARD